MKSIWVKRLSSEFRKLMAVDRDMKKFDAILRVKEVEGR